MATLDQIYQKIEAERLKRLEEQKLLEQQQFEEFERQRQFMLREREYYENLYERVISSTAVAGVGSGGHHKPITHPQTTLIVDASISNYVYLEFSQELSVTWSDDSYSYGTTVDHTYGTSGVYNVIINGDNFETNDSLYISSGIVGIDGPISMPALTDLNIEESYISGMSNALSGLTNLTNFSIYDTPIESINSDAFSTNINLVNLFIGSSDLLIDISTLDLSNLILLETIDINNCSNGIGLNIGNIFINLPSLYSLSLNDNALNLTGSLSGATFEGLPLLNTLNLYNNDFGVLPNIITGITTLTNLNISNCNLSTLPILPSGLTNLIISANNFTTLEYVTGLTNLIYLGADSNQITDIPISLLNLTNLSSLLLNDNQLTSIPSYITGLTNLTVLGLAQNNFGEIDNVIRNMPLLNEIYLNNSNITSISGSTFIGLTTFTVPAIFSNAHRINIQDNGLSSNEIDNFFINCDNAGFNSVFINCLHGNSLRTSASDDAVTNLISRNCYII